MTTVKVPGGAETRCDFPGCNESYFQEAFQPAPAGWTSVDPPRPADFPLDYCPEHSRTETSG